MSWPWTSTEEAARRRAERQARFVRIGRDAHESARRYLGPQQLKPRDWEVEPDFGKRRRPGDAPGSVRS